MLFEVNKLLNPNDLMRAAEAGGSVFLALQIVGNVRCELDQLTSLVEAGMIEAEEIVAINPDRLERTLNIGRAIIDLLGNNSQRLGLVERHLMRRRVQPVLPLFDGAAAAPAQLH